MTIRPDADKEASPAVGTAARDFFDISRPQARRSMLFLAAGALLGLAIAGYGLFTAKGTRSHFVPADAIVLVNNRPILRSDFMTQVQTQFATPFQDSTPAQRKQVLDDMITEELTVQRGLEIDLPSFDPEVRAALVAGVELEISANVLAEQPSEEQLRAYYATHRDRYVSEGVMRMRELVAKPAAGHGIDQAMAAAQQAVIALRGAVALDRVMQRYGLEDSGRLMDAGHVDTGEIFDFAAKAKLDPAVYAVAAKLPGGQVSDPIKQDDGAHVLVMVEHRMPVQEDYAAAADRVWSDYKSDAQNKVRAASVRQLRRRADILMSDDARKLEVQAQ